MRTVILVIGFTKLALEAGADLSANTNTVTNLNGCHLVANFDSLANDFMTDADWEWAVAPTASDGMDVRAANTAAFNLDVDVTIFELFRFELACNQPRAEKLRQVTQWLLTSFFSNSLHLL